MRTETRVGIFVLVAIAIMSVGAIYIGNITMFGKGYEISVLFDFAGGLRLRGKVMRAGGEPVGFVTKIGTDHERGKAKVALWLREDVRIPKNAGFTITSGSIMGEKYINVTGGTAEAGFFTAGEVADGATPTSMDEMMGVAAKATTRVTETLISFSTLLGSEEMKGALKGLAQTMLGIQRMVEDMRPRMAASMENLETTTAALARSSQSLTLMADGLREFAGVQNRENMARMMEHLSRMTERLDRTTVVLEATASRLSAGQGMLGMLVQDDELARDLKTFVKKIKDDPGLLGSRLLSGPPAPKR